MQRLIATNSVPLSGADVAPTTGTPQYATDGNPGVTPPTVWPAYAWNMVQEELIAALTAAGLTPSGTNWAQLAQAIGIIPEGRLLNVQAFASSGTYTPTVGTRLIKVKIIGGGGAGAGTEAVGAGAISVGAGGAAGGYAEASFLLASIATPVSVTIGDGGFGGEGNGGDGAPSEFGPYIICPGGGGGIVIQVANTVPFAVAGQGSAGALPTVTGNIPGLPTIVAFGQPGLVGLAFSGSGVSGQGARSIFGSGAPNTAGGPTDPGNGYGAGGGGAVVQSGGAAVAGGSGSGGFCEIEEYS